MEKVRRQHYVPRMYLKRLGYGNIDDEYISVLKLDNGTVLDNRKVENFAVANYFYDADKEQIAEILKEDLKVFDIEKYIYGLFKDIDKQEANLWMQFI